MATESVSRESLTSAVDLGIVLIHLSFLFLSEWAQGRDG